MAKKKAPKAQRAPTPNATYDLVVIGAGPGGYVCALRAAQLGMRVALVEERAALGGTCLNVGCIPSKAMLHASARFAEQAEAKALGIDGVGRPKLNLSAMLAYQRQTIRANVDGVAFLMKKNAVDVLTGRGTIAGAGAVSVEAKGKPSAEGSHKLTAKHIVLATGSAPMPLANIDWDEKQILSSTGALSLKSVPRELLVIGGGIIGLELGSVWARLGARVTVVEMENRIAMGCDAELARRLQQILTKQGLAFRLGEKVTDLKKSARGFTAELAPAAGGKTTNLKPSHVLVAVGRRPHTEGLGLDAAGVERDEAGRITIGKDFATSVAGIYAIGDVVAGPMLAHKASDEGTALAEQLAGQPSTINYDAIPNVIYTHPEAAWVGRSEEELKAAGVAYQKGKFPLSANGRAKLMQADAGFVKLLTDKANDRLLGAHIVAPNAGDMIAELVVAMEFGASAEDIARSCHAHPTVSEAVREAALAANGRVLHM